MTTTRMETGKSPTIVKNEFGRSTGKRIGTVEPLGRVIRIVADPKLSGMGTFEPTCNLSNQQCTARPIRDMTDPCFGIIPFAGR